MLPVVLGLGMLAIVAVMAWWAIGTMRRGRSLDRFYRDDEAAVIRAATAPPSDEAADPLTRWLSAAGYRRGGAAGMFVMSTLAAAGVGLGSALLFSASGIAPMMELAVTSIPGGVGEAFLPVIWVAPWIIGLILAAVPALVVRSARRQRVTSIECDLPLAMELLVSLSEAGLGFDAALSRVLRTKVAGRPLANEGGLYQSDVMAGRSTVAALRSLSRRVAIPSMSILISALVQAEQMGMGISGVLRRQADDLRVRRRERAIAFAGTLPVKRMFPLVICFLPGLFVWTLGPAFVQLFRLTETFTR